MKKMQGVVNILLEKETLYKMKTASCTKKHVFNISICHIPRNEKINIHFPLNIMLLLFNHFSCVRLCVTLWTAASQAPLPMRFSREEYSNG